MGQFAGVGGAIYLTAVAMLTLVITYTDLRWYWVPDVGVLCLAAVQAVALGMHLVEPDLAVSAGVSLFFILIYVFSRGGMGSGDVKLGIVLSIGCTGIGAYGMVLFAFASALVIAVPRRFVRGSGYVPFAPFLLAGWWVSLIFYKEWVRCVLPVSP